MCNETLLKILSLNPLTHLEEIDITEGENLNRDSLDILLNNCTNLRKVKGMKYWKGMTDDEREEVKLHVKKNNLDLDIKEAVLTDLSVFVHKVNLSEAQRKFLSTS